MSSGPDTRRTRSAFLRRFVRRLSARTSLVSSAALSIVGLTLLAAVLRASTLDRQSFWSDEAITVLLMRMSFGDMLRTVAETESTPPVYYVVAWLWTQVFGDGEVGLRALSALAGVATVPVAYAAGSALLGRRVGVAAAGLVAVSPQLVWYSQEARSYALATLLCGASFAVFARMRSTPATSTLVLWSTLSVLAIGTHYFAGFVVAVQAAWLFVLHGRATVWHSVAATSLGALAVLPLALEQRGNAGSIGADGLAERAVIVSKQLLAGPALPADRIIAGVAALLVAASLVYGVARGDWATRRGVLVAATVGGAAFVLPLALALLGFDYLNTRNALVGAVPLSVAAVAGLAVAAPRRVGTFALTGLCVLLASVTMAVAADASFHRPDWRGLADGMGRPDVARVLVVTPDHQGWFARVALQLYLPRANAIDRGLTSTPQQFARVSRRSSDRASPRVFTVREVIVAGVGWETPTLPTSLARVFLLVEDMDANGYRFRRYRSARPAVVTTSTLALPLSAILLEKPRP